MNVIYSVDWLQYSVVTADDEPELYCPDGFRVEVMSGNNIFRYRAIVTDGHGRKWLTLLWSPYSRVLNPRLMTVQVGNELLYSSAINESWRVLQQVVECRFNSMGRLDLCGDFPITDEQLETVKQLNSGHYYVQGKHEGSSWWHHTTADGSTAYRKQMHCQTWGSPKSEIKVKLYHKSREQGMLCENPQPDKPYIVANWVDAGWDVRRVWRLEFSMSTSGQLQWDRKPITLEQVSSCEWCASVFRGLYGRRFVVRENQGRRTAKHNSDRVVDFLTLTGDVQGLQWCPSGNPVPVAGEVTLLRRLMADLHTPTVMSSEEMAYSYVSTISTLVERGGLQRYFREHFGGEYADVLGDVLRSSGSQVLEVDPYPNRIFS